MNATTNSPTAAVPSPTMASAKVPPPVTGNPGIVGVTSSSGSNNSKVVGSTSVGTTSATATSIITAPITTAQQQQNQKQTMSNVS